MATIETQGAEHPKTITLVATADEHDAINAELQKQWGADDDVARIFAEAAPATLDADGKPDTYRITLPNDAVAEFQTLAAEVGGTWTDAADSIAALRDEALAAVSARTGYGDGPAPTAAEQQPA